MSLWNCNSCRNSSQPLNIKLNEYNMKGTKSGMMGKSRGGVRDWISTAKF